MCNSDNNEKLMELEALIHHMKHHTEHHTEEIVKLMETARSLGLDDTAESLNECIALSEKLISEFGKALESMKG
ncbi:MAG: hypothetical protein IJP24_05420 [Firmicutes bacterium]|nr:hypothetical protein [Bacillota bacterium]